MIRGKNIRDKIKNICYHIKMITIKDNIFNLETENTSYIFRTTKHNHLEHIYFGSKLNLSEHDVETVGK